jgi:hypothetical protein
MKGKIIVAFCILLTVIGTVIFAKNSETVIDSSNTVTSVNTIHQKLNEAITTQVKENTMNTPPPDYRVFDMIFNLVKSLDEAAAKLESQGKSGNIWRKYFEREAGLTAQQVAILRQVANDFAREVAPVHRRAMQIVNERRASGATTRKPFPPSPELATLQTQRDAIALRNGNRLQTLLSPEIIELLRRVLEQNHNDTNPLTDDEQQLFAERAKRFRTNSNRTSENQLQGGTHQ